MPVVYDLTSDTATQPTDDMFDLMKTASRGDDVFSVGFPPHTHTLAALLSLLSLTNHSLVCLLCSKMNLCMNWKSIWLTFLVMKRRCLALQAP